ncbi:MAG: M10 family metallopeptidase C-terminal domain-containing protein [Alphaproteobacteria bacterium]|nr:M10 family metallopeptidase C-terminal domain-containing protein [Alphaproteobacteria bacterium]
MVDKATASENVVPPTGNAFLDTLIIGHKWNDDHPVTFYFDNGTAPEDVWLDGAKDAVRNALSTYETYIALEFDEVDNQADANFVLRMNSLDEIGATARFGYPDESDDQAVGQFPFDWSRWTPWHLEVGGYAFETVVHELGHGLGLGHPFEEGGLNGQTFPGATDSGEVGDDGQNNAVYTVMSYLDHSQFWAPTPPTSDLGWGYIASPMGLDIAALQHIYGANPSSNAGNSTYTLPTVDGDGTYWKAIWDTGGSDIIRHTGSAPATIDLRAAPLVGPNAGGYLSRVDGIAGGFTIANGVTIEYAEGGSGDDIIIGNGAGNEIAGRGGNDAISGLGGDDLIDGGAGNDSLNGGGGEDTMVGGSGNDQFLVDSAQDEFHEAAGGGTDTVITTITYTLGANFENLQLAESNLDGIDGYGNAAANQVIGNGDANVLEGRGGDDFLNGGAGRDVLDGGTGKDTLLGGTGDDILDGGADEGAIVLAAAAGGGDTRAGITAPDPDRGIADVLTDQRTSRPSGGYDDELHGGQGQDTLTGRGGDDVLHGDGGDDRLLGGNGADWLDGGSGRDVMTGDADNDIYVVDSPFDTVIEGPGQGIDGVFSSVGYALGADVENLALTGGPANHISGTGNGLANWIVGNDGSNVIDGLGKDDLLAGMGGNDFLDGGTGADTVFGGEGDDVLDGGDDAVIVLEGDLPALGAGSGDSLLGGNGDDILYGRGGNDALQGDAGDDELYGESGSDTAAGGQGDDTAVGGAGADSLLGEEGDDSLSGGGGNDRLNGGVGADTMNGGAGNDMMIGGAGDDVFVVDAAGDTVLEGLALGTDGVFSAISYTLAANVENLMLVASAIPDIDATGNELANLIIGNGDANAIAGLAGDDLLAGVGGDDALAGGMGLDTLQGGGGDDLLAGGDDADRFEFSGDFGADAIADFDPGKGDRLRISGFGAGLDDFAELKAYVTDDGTDTTIDLSALGGGTILLASFVGLQALDVELFA